VWWQPFSFLYGDTKNRKCKKKKKEEEEETKKEEVFQGF
jgi:hypothetical protein